MIMLLRRDGNLMLEVVSVGSRSLLLLCVDGIHVL